MQMFIKPIFLISTILLSLLSITDELKGYQIKYANTIKIEMGDTKEDIIAKAAHVIPTPNQYQALKNEFIVSIHFGPNTFTNTDWGSGKEDPTVFNPTSLDTDQWCKTLKAAGVTMAVITAKHHDGYVLWQSRYTKHGIMSSPFQKGKGDVVKDLSLSCKKYGIKLSIYLSPADMYQTLSKDGYYANKSPFTERTIPRKVKGRRFKNKTKFKFLVDDYNEYFLNQMFELLTEYGPVHEVWFDGAHPLGKRGQVYNYAAWKTLIKTLAPESVTFNKEDIRWCGNEGGTTRESEWSIIPFKEDPRTMNEFRDIMGESLGSRNELYQGKYLHYYPAEVNMTIRDGWFFRPDKKQGVRSANNVFEMYERIIGRNSIFNLNIPPNRDGKFDDREVKVLNEVGRRIKETYSHNLLSNTTDQPNLVDNNVNTYHLMTKDSLNIIITTQEPVTINHFVVQEAITTHSERIEEHYIYAWVNEKWKRISSATNVGYKRTHFFSEVTSNKFRLMVKKYRLEPAIAELAAYFCKYKHY